MLNVINEEFKFHTVISVAHKLQTILKSDEIIVMEKGSIVQRGKPIDMLLKDKEDNNITQNGPFSELVKATGYIESMNILRLVKL